MQIWSGAPVPCDANFSRMQEILGSREAHESDPEGASAPRKTLGSAKTDALAGNSDKSGKKIVAQRKVERLLIKILECQGAKLLGFRPPR